MNTHWCNFLMLHLFWLTWNKHYEYRLVPDCLLVAVPNVVCSYTALWTGVHRETLVLYCMIWNWLSECGL